MAHDISHKVAEFFAAYPQRTFDTSQLLIRPGEPLEVIFYLLEGRVSEYDVTPLGNEVVVNVFKPGAFFPMSAALNGTPNEYFFEASAPVKAHVAPAAVAVQFLEDNPDVALDLLKRVYQGVDGVLRRMAHLMGGDAKHRLLFEIVNAAYRFGVVQEDGSVHISLHESALGKQSGLARETVNRTLQGLKQADLIRVTRSGLIVTNLKELEVLLGDSI